MPQIAYLVSTIHRLVSIHVRLVSRQQASRLMSAGISSHVSRHLVSRQQASRLTSAGISTRDSSHLVSRQKYSGSRTLTALSWTYRWCYVDITTKTTTAAAVSRQPRTPSILAATRETTSVSNGDIKRQTTTDGLMMEADVDIESLVQ